MPPVRRGRGSKSPDTPPALPIRAAALGLLARRDYTVKELAARLARRGYEEDAIARVTAVLRAAGHLDDRRAAAAHVRAASRIKRRGRALIARELEARGVDRDTARDAVGAVSADDDLAGIRELLRRRRYPARPTPAERRRMFHHLLRRGFAADLIGRALGRNAAADEEDGEDGHGGGTT